MAVKSEVRSVSGFSSIEVQGTGDLFVEQGPLETGEGNLVMEADEEILSRLKCEVRGETLVLAWDLPWWEWITWWFQWVLIPDKSIRYRVKADQIRGLALQGAGAISCPAIQTDACRLNISGAGKIRIDRLEASETVEARISGTGEIQAEMVKTQGLKISISGGGNIILSGAAERYEVRISGSGNIRTAGLETRETSISISGSGYAQVNAAEALDVNISGAGTIEYTGQPRITQRISGAGQVREAK